MAMACSYRVSVSSDLDATAGGDANSEVFTDVTGDTASDRDVLTDPGMQDTLVPDNLETGDTFEVIDITAIDADNDAVDAGHDARHETIDADYDVFDAAISDGTEIREDTAISDDAEILEDIPDADAEDAPEDTAINEPDIAPRRTLSEGFHVTPVIPDPGQAFSMIVASDPQLWWNTIDNTSGVSDEAAEAQIQLHIDAMNALIAGQYLPTDQSAPVGIIMNGDITEYGRWAQWDAYYRLFEGADAPIWDGLGNHDYSNNNPLVSNGCSIDAFEFLAWSNACDAGSSQTVWGRPACVVAEGLLEDDRWCALDSMRRTRHWLDTHSAYIYDHDEGSAAYSFEMGDIHFIQLHDATDFQVPETTICSSVNWLKKDLKAAFDRNKRIVLLMHKPPTSVLTPLLIGYQYNVVGIFFGHIHQNAGYTGNLKVGNVNIPKFYTGSVQWNMFSLAFFGTGSLTVTAIDSNTGTPVHYADSASYNNLSGATASAPFTYAYPQNPCPSGQAPEGTPEATCFTPGTNLPAIELCY
jgi:cytolysin (calcineurin-like family phosphatase)